MIISQLPALQVVLPLIAAPLCLLLYRPLATWLLTVITSAAAMLISGLILAQVLDQGVIDYTFGVGPHLLALPTELIS